MGAVTVLHVLLFVWVASVLREWEGDGNVGVWAGEGGVVASVGCEYMGSTLQKYVVQVLCIVQMMC